jgi:hypothetical protein
MKLLTGYYLLKSTATGHGLDGPEIESLWRWDYSHLSSPVLRPTQLTVLWVPAHSRRYRSRCVVDHPSSSSAEVKKTVELYLYSPAGPSWPVQGWNLPFSFCRSYWTRDGSAAVVRSDGIVVTVPAEKNRTEIEKCVIKTMTILLHCIMH